MATPKANPTPSDEFIEIEEISVTPRGRKAVIDPVLAAKLANIPEGKAVVLTSIGSVAKPERAKVSQKIRKHWQAVRPDNCQIRYSTEGVPQVFAAHKDAS